MTNARQKYIIILSGKKGGDSLSGTKKIGRPTNDPKNLKLTIRFNDEQSKKIKDYSEKNSLTMSEVVRKAVDDLK